MTCWNSSIRTKFNRRCRWAGVLALAAGGSVSAGDNVAIPVSQSPEGSIRQTQQLVEFPEQPLTTDPIVTEEGFLSAGVTRAAESNEPWTLNDALFRNDDPPITIGGWTQNGYHNRSTGLFDAHPDQFVSHQNYLYMERVANGSEGLDFGFRGDILYGADAQDTQAFGDPLAPDGGHWDNKWDHGFYGWALPQLYAEAAYGDFSVKVGHFYTIVGYEVVTAPGNFFNSHSYTMYNSEPFTHSGALATYTASDKVTVYGGWVAGWDTGFDAKADNDQSHGSAFIGGTSLAITDTFTLTYVMLVGDMGIRGEGYNHSIVADWKITDKLNYIAQTDLVELNNPTFGFNHTIGFDNFLLYSITDKLGIGGRAEWWKPNGHSVYQITGGLNIIPVENLIIRPEVRYQWGDDQIIEGLAGFNGQPGVSDSAIFGIDAILTF